jgi:hypothetical protein
MFQPCVPGTWLVALRVWWSPAAAVIWTIPTKTRLKCNRCCEDWGGVEWILRLMDKGLFKKPVWGRRQWLTPVILPTWEAEIRRIMVWGQPRQIVHETPSSKYSEQNGPEVWLKQ